MNLERLVAVSGRPGIYRMAANRPNGLILEELDSKKRMFASGRVHQFTPLESISIYTEDEQDTVDLKQVFRNMFSQLEQLPTPSSKAKPQELRSYFLEILPSHDTDRVLISDIKKIIKWFNFLNDRGIIDLEPDPVVEEETPTEEENTEA